MSNPFHDLLKVKERKTSKNFSAPTKEQATTGTFMPAGDDFGIGRKVPVGTEKVSDKQAVPQKSFCFEPKDVI